MCKECERKGGLIEYIEEVDTYIMNIDGINTAICNCPWCGRKLEAPEKFVPVLSDKELIAELLTSRDELENKIERLDERLTRICVNLYQIVKKCRWDEKQN